MPSHSSCLQYKLAWITGESQFFRQCRFSGQCRFSRQCWFSRPCRFSRLKCQFSRQCAQFSLECQSSGGVFLVPPKSRPWRCRPLSFPCLKGQSNEIFDLLFFSSFQPAWATDQWVKIFSYLVLFSPRYSNFNCEKTDSPGYDTRGRLTLRSIIPRGVSEKFK